MQQQMIGCYNVSSLRLTDCEIYDTIADSNVKCMLPDVTKCY